MSRITAGPCGPDAIDATLPGRTGTVTTMTGSSDPATAQVPFDPWSLPAATIAIDVDSIEPEVVGPGCTIRTLTLDAHHEMWVADIEAGAEWPEVDHHDGPELVVVVSGEVIEGTRPHGPGTFLAFGPGSSHRPRSESGVRLVGVNLSTSAGDAASS